MRNARFSNTDFRPNAYIREDFINSGNFSDFALQCTRCISVNACRCYIFSIRVFHFNHLTGRSQSNYCINARSKLEQMLVRFKAFLTPLEFPSYFYFKNRQFIIIYSHYKYIQVYIRKSTGGSGGSTPDFQAGGFVIRFLSRYQWKFSKY